MDNASEQRRVRQLRRPGRNRHTRLGLERLEPRSLLTTLAETLIPRGATWNYLADGSDQGQSADGSNWFAHPDYDDTSSGPAGAWESGPAELGYGDSQQTVVDFVDADPATGGIQKNATTYFRTTFQVADPMAFDYLIYLKYDDGAAVYINGVEAARSANLAPNAHFDDYTINGQTTPEEDAYFRFDVLAAAQAALQPGENVLAVEIHQANATSSDISFDLELQARHPLSLNVSSQVVASGLQRPVYMVAPPGDSDRLFIVEQAGRIRILDLSTGQLRATPFLDIDARVLGFNDSGNERGLLGLAFPPDYATKNYFYVNYTAASLGGDTVVSRFDVTANPDVADPGSESIILTVDQPFSNHNAGWIDFGPDGYLYIATGDGGSGNDPGNRAQDVTNQLLGKILRIDVEGAPAGVPYVVPPSNPLVGVTGDDEIWASGLRNPYRNSFDRQTGDLYIADVGQGALEEVNVQPATSRGGENYGWRVMEGTRCNFPNDPLPCFDASLTPPVYEYGRPSLAGGDLIFEGASTTGGYVYRGPASLLDGHYFFGDFVSSRIWSFHLEDGQATQLIDWTDQLVPGGPNGVSSFGEDAAGELYFSDFSGIVRRITAPNLSFQIRAVEVNGTQVDPPDLLDGPQPTHWRTQRSQLASLDIAFTAPIGSLTARDLTLTNLGRNAPQDPDRIVPLTEANVNVTDNRVSLSAFDPPLEDGVYRLQIADTVTDQQGESLDGDADGIPGGVFTLIGDANSKLYVLRGDFNGDEAGSVFDFPTFSYWFGRIVGVAPAYADLNRDQGVSIFDFPVFADNFGSGVVFAPPPAPPVAAPPTDARRSTGDARAHLESLPASAPDLRLWDWHTRVDPLRWRFLDE